MMKGLRGVLPALQIVISLLKNALGYKLVESSIVTCDYITTPNECEIAALQLGLSDISATDDGQNGVTYDPPFCYFEGGILKFNFGGTNKGTCGSYDKCVCGGGSTTSYTTATTTTITTTTSTTTTTTLTPHCINTGGHSWDCGGRFGRDNPL